MMPLSNDVDLPPGSRGTDVADALGWLLLGTAIVAASLVMDRLESQDVPPFAAPGLLPGLLGIGLLLGGGVLLARSLRHGSHGITAVAPREPRSRAALVIALCVLFGGVLVGHGLPFWMAAAVFVTATILLLQPRQAQRRQFDARRVFTAAAIGLAAGGAVTLVFQYIFLVRLP